MLQLQIDAVGVTVKAGRKVLLDDFSLSILPGELAGLLGPSGSGKSTLLKVVAGLSRPSSGKVYYGGLELAAAPENIALHAGFVPQEDIIPTALKAGRILHFAALLRLPPRMAPKERKELIGRIAARLELTEHLRTKVDNLSGGQRKRLSLAMELITGPAVLFLDEPTSGLDPGLEKKFMELFRTLSREGRTVVVTTHVMEHVALLDILFLVYRGRLAYAGPPAGALAYFAVVDYPEIFTRLEEMEPVKWKERFSQTLFFQQYVTARQERLR